MNKLHPRLEIIESLKHCSSYSRYIIVQTVQAVLIF